MTSEKPETLAMPFSSRSRIFVRRLIGDRTYYQLRAERHISRHRRSEAPLLFVHQMGKVGSTSVVANLEQQGVPSEYNVYQTHFLTSEGYSFLEGLELAGHGGWKNLPEKGKSFLSLSRVLSREIERGYLQGRTVKVISLVRDPVATNLSGYFHNTDWWPEELREVAIKRELNWQERLWEHFVATYPHSVPATWFDMEMKPLFDIDVMATDFPRQVGYKIYASDVAELLLLKLEKLEDCAADAFGEFLGVDYYRAISTNRADDKWYASLYAEFKRSMPIPETYLAEQYGSAFARHFYTEYELEGFVRYWRRLSVGKG